jgi:hypothetical protein
MIMKELLPVIIAIAMIIVDVPIKRSICATGTFTTWMGRLAAPMIINTAMKEPPIGTKELVAGKSRG